MRVPLRSWGTTIVLVVGLIAMTMPAAMAGGSFIDDDGNTHEAAIEAIVMASITIGCDDFLYCPTDPVTRGQMASFLARGFDLPAASDDYFADDAGTHEDNINRIAEAGITGGFADGTYRPDETVSRGQMASFLARALSLDPVDGSSFTDVDGVHARNIYAIAAAGITVGCNADGTEFCPTDPVRRDQMASFLARALELVLESVPDETYDIVWEQCVFDGLATAAAALDTIDTVLYAPQSAIARDDAAFMQSQGPDWIDNPPDETYLTDDILAELGIDAGYFVTERVTQGLNQTCEGMVEAAAPGETSSPAYRYFGVGAVVDPANGWLYQVVYQITITEF